MILSLDCAFCGDLATHYCGDCKQINYCSEPCQKAHWYEQHQYDHKSNFDVKEIEKNYDLEEIEADGTMVWQPKTELIERRRRSSKKWIHGAIEHPGSFTRAAKHRHMSTAKFARKVLADKHHRYSSRLHHQAQLYKTLTHMKHRGKKKKK